MGFDFKQMIGGGGATGEVLTGLDLAVEATLCVGLLDIFACFKALVDLFELVFELFLGNVFAGRPKVGKDSASDDTALFFIAAANPVIQLWGMGIRGLEGQGIPTSVSGGPGLTKTLELAEAVLQDLRLQFDGPTAPKLFLHNEFGTYPVTGLNMFTWYHQLGFNTHNPDSNTPVINERQIIDTYYNILVRDHYLDPKTGFPFQPGGGPPPPPPPPPQPGHIPPPPKAPPANADEAEICCWYEEQYQYWQAAGLDQIYNLLKQQGQNDQCCNRVIMALTSINTVLGSVAAAIAVGARELSAPIDLTPIERGLGALLTELHADNTAAHTVAGELLKAVERIAVAEEKEKAIDLKPVVDVINHFAKIMDVSPATIKLLVKKGFIDPQDAQIIESADLGSWLLHTLETYGWDALVWASKYLGVDITGPELKLNPLGDTIAKVVEKFMDITLDVGAVPLYAVVHGALEGVLDQVRPTHAPTIGDAGVDDSLLLAKTLGPILIVNAVCFILSWFDLGGGEVMAKWVEVVSAVTGFEEIKEVQLGQDMQAGPIAAARLRAQRMYRQNLPGANQLYALATRDLITVNRAAALNGYNGIPDELHGPLQTAAYSGLNPRQLLRLSATGLFDAADLADEMTFAGLRAASQHRMLIAAPYLATDPERKQLRATYEKAYVEGFLADQELTQQLDDAEHNTSRTFLILDRVRLEKRMALAKELEAEYTTLYLGNQITLNTYHANLAGLGLQDDRVRALTAKAEARAAVTLARAEAAAARKEAAATAAVERKAALRNYLQGNIPAAALAIALEATGLTHAQTAAWVDMAALQLAGAPRYKFGLRLTPDQAQLLTDRVRALDDQRKRQLITDAVFINALKALHIPPLYINALRAAAEATITPAKSAAVITVETGA